MEMEKEAVDKVLDEYIQKWGERQTSLGTIFFGDVNGNKASYIYDYLANKESGGQKVKVQVIYQAI